MDVLSRIKSEIIVPLIALLFVVAVVYFMWGVVQYIYNMNNPTAKQDGQRHMFWGVIGLAIMLSAFGIVNFVFNTVTNTNGTAVNGIDGKPIPKPDILQQQKF
jgi:hypothetical protein